MQLNTQDHDSWVLNSETVVIKRWNICYLLIHSGVREARRAPLPPGPWKEMQASLISCELSKHHADSRLGRRAKLCMTQIIVGSSLHAGAGCPLNGFSPHSSVFQIILVATRESSRAYRFVLASVTCQIWESWHLLVRPRNSGGCRWP